MKPVKLGDSEWKKIHEYLRGNPQVKVGSARKCRRFIEAVLWVSRSGAQWRLLPATYGKWNSVYRRFARWCEAGVWEQMFSHFAKDMDMENVMLAQALVDGLCFSNLLADRGYDSDDLLAFILEHQATPVIPPRRNRKQPREYDHYLYRDRHLVECFFNKIKHYRRLFSRFDKLSSRYLGFLYFVASRIWLR